MKSQPSLRLQLPLVLGRLAWAVTWMEEGVAGCRGSYFKALLNLYKLLVGRLDSFRFHGFCIKAYRHREKPISSSLTNERWRRCLPVDSPKTRWRLTDRSRRFLLHRKPFAISGRLAESSAYHRTLDCDRTTRSSQGWKDDPQLNDVVWDYLRRLLLNHP